MPVAAGRPAPTAVAENTQITQVTTNITRDCTSALDTRIADLPARSDVPRRSLTARGGSSAALSALASDGLDRLVQEICEDRYARSASAPRASVVRTWIRFHEAAFGSGPNAVPVLPVYAEVILGRGVPV